MRASTSLNSILFLLSNAIFLSSLIELSKIGTNANFDLLLLFMIATPCVEWFPKGVLFEIPESLLSFKSSSPSRIVIIEFSGQVIPPKPKR